jgi:hypothetical protein
MKYTEIQYKIHIKYKRRRIYYIFWMNNTQRVKHGIRRSRGDVSGQVPCL